MQFILLLGVLYASFVDASLFANYSNCNELVSRFKIGLFLHFHINLPSDIEIMYFAFSLNLCYFTNGSLKNVSEFYAPSLLAFAYSFGYHIRELRRYKQAWIDGGRVGNAPDMVPSPAVFLEDLYLANVQVKAFHSRFINYLSKCRIHDSRYAKISHNEFNLQLTAFRYIQWLCARNMERYYDNDAALFNEFLAFLLVSNDEMLEFSISSWATDHEYLTFYALRRLLRPMIYTHVFVLFYPIFFDTIKEAPIGASGPIFSFENVNLMYRYINAKCTGAADHVIVQDIIRNFLLRFYAKIQNLYFVENPGLSFQLFFMSKNEVTFSVLPFLRNQKKYFMDIVKMKTSEIGVLATLHISLVLKEQLCKYILHYEDPVFIGNFKVSINSCVDELWKLHFNLPFSDVVDKFLSCETLTPKALTTRCVSHYYCSFLKSFDAFVSDNPTLEGRARHNRASLFNIYLLLLMHSSTPVPLDFSCVFFYCEIFDTRCIDKISLQLAESIRSIGGCLSKSPSLSPVYAKFMSLIRALKVYSKYHWMFRGASYFPILLSRNVDLQDVSLETLTDLIKTYDLLNNILLFKALYKKYMEFLSREYGATIYLARDVSTLDLTSLAYLTIQSEFHCIMPDNKI